MVKKTVGEELIGQIDNKTMMENGEIINIMDKVSGQLIKEFLDQANSIKGPELNG